MLVTTWERKSPYFRDYRHSKKQNSQRYAACKTPAVPAFLQYMSVSMDIIEEQPTYTIL